MEVIDQEAVAQLTRLKTYMVLAILGCVLLCTSLLVLAATHLYKRGGSKQLLSMLGAWSQLLLSPRGKPETENAASSRLQLLTYSYSSSNTLSYNFRLGDKGGLTDDELPSGSEEWKSEREVTGSGDFVADEEAMDIASPNREDKLLLPQLKKFFPNP